MNKLKNIRKMYIGNREIINRGIYLNNKQLIYDNLPFKKQGTYVAGDVVLYDLKHDKKVVIDVNNLSQLNPSNYEPIGVVVIPSSHDVYGTGEAGVMALRNPSYKTPEQGTTSEERIYWGQTRIDIPGLNNFEGVVAYDSNKKDFKTLVYRQHYGLLPTDQYPFGEEVKNPNLDTDQDSWYLANMSSQNYLIPSPYDGQGGRNPDYSTTTISNNSLSDLDGKSNTSILTSISTSVDWSVTPMPNLLVQGYYPLACACYRYTTKGTKQGDWYLVSSGEASYIVARYKKITSSMELALKFFHMQIPTYVVIGWTSTERNFTNAAFIDLSDATNNSAGKENAAGGYIFTRIK